MTETWGEEAQGLLEAATPGPWFVESDGVYDQYRSWLVVPTGRGEQDDLDAALIAAAPTLAARVVTLEAVARRLLEGWVAGEGLIANGYWWHPTTPQVNDWVRMSPPEVELIEALRGKG